MFFIITLLVFFQDPSAAEKHLSRERDPRLTIVNVYSGLQSVGKSANSRQDNAMLPLSDDISETEYNSKHKDELKQQQDKLESEEDEENENENEEEEDDEKEEEDEKEDDREKEKEEKKDKEKKFETVEKGEQLLGKKSLQKQVDKHSKKNDKHWMKSSIYFNNAKLESNPEATDQLDPFPEINKFNKYNSQSESTEFLSKLIENHHEYDWDMFRKLLQHYPHKLE